MLELCLSSFECLLFLSNLPGQERKTRCLHSSCSYFWLPFSSSHTNPFLESVSSPLHVLWHERAFLFCLGRKIPHHLSSLSRLRSGAKPKSFRAHLSPCRATDDDGGRRREEDDEASWVREMTSPVSKMEKRACLLASSLPRERYRTHTYG